MTLDVMAYATDRGELAGVTVVVDGEDDHPFSRNVVRYSHDDKLTDELKIKEVATKTKSGH
jgi:hypothetical protein